MKRILAILTLFAVAFTATAQVENSIVIDTKSFRAVQQDELTGVNIDPIGLDHSRQACARIKIKFDRMSKGQIDALEVKMRSNTDLTKQKVADYYDNVLILEMTAKPNTRFYFYSPEFGESNEVTLNLEGNSEYEMLASLNQAFSIVVESNVVGADIYIDGVFKGQTGDNKKCTISDVMIGEHRLKVVYGSASSEKIIDVNKNAISFTQNVNIAATEPQYVVFAVEPKTASVIIDDKPQTPDEGGVVTTVLQAGTYSYSVSAKMYHSQSGTFTVAGAKVQKSVALAPAFGYLSVGGGMVNGATVFVDDENIGTAPVKSDKLASGEHSVRIVKDKYKPYSTTVTVRDSETTTLTPTLSADFATVTLTTASGATIWVNGVEKGSGSWSGELSTGTYIFEARQSGHRSAQISKTIAATPSRQSYAIPAPTPIVGSVDITSSPAMADITLDGKAVGTTPLKLSSLLVGQHKITVSKSGYQPYTTTITVAEGRTATVSAELIKGKIYKVGDYYNENGKQGVVFEVSADGRHGKIVSMKQSAEKLQWSSDETEQKRLIGADSKTDGAYNMAKVKAISGWRDKYPTFAWCADLGEGWYLPAIDELKTFTLNDAVHDAVNRTLIARGGTKLYNRGEWEHYWSSTESDSKLSGEFCAWYVCMYNGNTDRSYEDNNFYVRAVSAF
ncbi:MAG: PEGA domain-containing protein [Alistipes sp.]|nr:PEGA domain-containing protein [Alistipes sp.]